MQFLLDKGSRDEENERDEADDADEDQGEIYGVYSQQNLFLYELENIEQSIHLQPCKKLYLLTINKLN